MIFGERISGKYNKFREDYPVVRRYPFNSNRKRMSILIEVKDKSYLMTKGASEIVLNGCTAWLNSKTMEAIPIKSELRN
jgi:Ca2+-transporting ATPase